MARVWRFAPVGVAAAALLAVSAAGASSNLSVNAGFEEGWTPDPAFHRLATDVAGALGRWYAVGQVTGSNQAARPTQRIAVRAGRRDQFRLRARAAPPQVKMALFGRWPADGQRTTTLVRAGNNGTVRAAWLSFRNRADTLQVARLEKADARWRIAARW